MKVLMFKVGINGLEDKIWRIIEVTDKVTIGDLAYSILASFNSLAYHLYSIIYKDREYKCFIDNDTMEMEYGFGSITTFKIKYLGSRELENIVKDTDELGYSKYPYSPGYGTKKIYDYREFDLKKNNIEIKKTYSLIKKAMKI